MNCFLKISKLSKIYNAVVPTPNLQPIQASGLKSTITQKA